MSEYSEKLKDPRWQKKRLEIFERDDWTCKKCKKNNKSLVVHHFEYEYGKKPWEYANNDLETLCFECHEEEHQAEKIFKNIISNINKTGIFYTDLLDFICLFKDLFVNRLSFKYLFVQFRRYFNKTETK